MTRFLLSVEEACVRYNVGRHTLTDLRRQGLPEVRYGSRVLIPVVAADAWFLERVGTDLAVDTDPTPANGIERPVAVSAS